MNNIEVFKDIKESSKIELKKILKERQLARKEILFNERDIVDKVYFLKQYLKSFEIDNKPLKKAKPFTLKK